MRLAVVNRTGGGASGGYKRYISAILPRLAACPEIEAVLCAAPPQLGLKSWLDPSPKIHFTDCEPFRFLRHAPDVGLRMALDAFGPDLLFVPLERYMRYGDIPVVTVLHNMAPLAGARTGSGLMSRIKSAAQAFETRTAVRRSAAVITPTDYVRKYLVKELGAPADKITAIKFGPSPVADELRRPERWRDGGGKFVFTTGSMEMYRGLEDLIAAMPVVKAKWPGLKLAVAGAARPATQTYLDSLKALAAAKGVEGDILWLGSLDDAEMAWCYTNCSAFAMTSRLESFGFPALEAMQHGCACVSAESPCLPEIFGEAAVYYPAGDSVALAARLNEALSRAPLEREKFSAHSLKRAGEFSWDSAAVATLQVLKKAAGAARLPV
ncbi:MAG: hypothetical protein CVU79_00410 [Elusimicrobia bacterium HGW-Elusimicrobia-3]|nr:MAG: hypothetical protein CVU79_00410 [Elusimicrobia bacterium HGW-Elusimicrobia-3]